MFSPLGPALTVLTSPSGPKPFVPAEVARAKVSQPNWRIISDSSFLLPVPCWFVHVSEISDSPKYSSSYCFSSGVSSFEYSRRKSYISVAVAIQVFWSKPSSTSRSQQL